MKTPYQLCTFHVAGLFLGLDVLAVQEVLRARELALVPLAPTNVEGLLNLRGQIVTAIDLRRRLGLPPSGAHEPPMIMIVRDEDGCVALLVDRVGDVIEVDDSTFESAPDTLPAFMRTLLLGVHKLPKQLLHVLDAREATAVTTHAA